MSKEMICPFCGRELEQMHDKKMLGCAGCLHIADGAFWAKVIQSQRDLQIAKQALKRTLNCDDVADMAAEALAQITHDNKGNDK